MSAAASAAPAPATSGRVLVVGSINADVFIDITRLPLPGETISTSRPDSGHVMPGGKGANQAVAVAKSLRADSAFETHWVGRFGDDAHASMLRGVLKENGVQDSLTSVAPVPSGQAFILLQADGQNSIILVPGANHVRIVHTAPASWPDALPEELSVALRSAAVVMLQREVPQRINIAVAAAAQAHGVPVVLDMGGEDLAMPDELLKSLTLLSANETELARLAGAPTDTDAQVREASLAVQARANASAGAQGQGQKLHVLLTLGSRGALLLLPDGQFLQQAALPVPRVVDTTGAGDCFRGAFTAAYLERKDWAECLRFASAAAALCIQTKGAMPSMPMRADIDALLQKQQQA